ncbi:hypothetical protein [Streptomyces sp. AC550_RSS872]|uniref:hypothetical protein n=1 Tax=Streptomyces sp. AC550_RSS872 TaxID=2823689 RepID=UPI001C275D90|nr:hypothetical protein [Streptomyces sp. AC550_RSS872]
MFTATVASLVFWGLLGFPNYSSIHTSRARRLVTRPDLEGKAASPRFGWSTIVRKLVTAGFRHGGTAARAGTLSRRLW